jgi:hypothetical protein
MPDSLIGRVAYLSTQANRAWLESPVVDDLEVEEDGEGHKKVKPKARRKP